MEDLHWIIELIIPALTTVAGWLVGRRQKNNMFLGELQSSIDMLASKNNDQMNEILKLREEVVKLRTENLSQSKEIIQVKEENRKLNEQMTELRKENQTLSEKVSALTQQLQGVKTITKSK